MISKLWIPAFAGMTTYTEIFSLSKCHSLPTPFSDLRDEIEHVRVGNRWYEYFCKQRGVDPEEEFQKLLREYGASRPRPPFHKEARLMAGFGEVELLYLETGTN